MEIQASEILTPGLAAEELVTRPSRRGGIRRAQGARRLPTDWAANRRASMRLPTNAVVTIRTDKRQVVKAVADISDEGIGLCGSPPPGLQHEPMEVERIVLATQTFPQSARLSLRWEVAEGRSARTRFGAKLAFEDRLARAQFFSFYLAAYRVFLEQRAREATLVAAPLAVR